MAILEYVHGYDSYVNVYTCPLASRVLLEYNFIFY